jgi:nucleoid-associated protein YgaU
LTTEHLFATITEHMFGTFDIRRLATLAAAAACAVALAMSYAPSSSSGAAPAHPHHHLVSTGETLWAIAEHAYPSADPRDAVYKIEQANDLHGADIAAGQVLVLP